MAEVMDVIEEQGEIEAVEEAQQEPEKVEQKPVEPELPEKYKGKTMDDIVKMHQEAEKLIGRQAQEVGEVRRLADELLKSQLEKKAEKEKPQEVDFFENPQEAIRQAIANSPDVLSAKQAATQMQQAQARQALQAKHPDLGQVLQNAEFADWVKASKVRLQLYNQADRNNDVDAADELLSTFKQLKAVKQQQVAATESKIEKEARDKTLQAVSVDTGGSGESSKKVYTRAKLLEMQLRRPDEYAAFADSGELAKAYREGRVR